MKQVKQFLFVVVSMVLLVSPLQQAHAAEALTVQEAMKEYDGTKVTVEGYIVGVPTSVYHVEQSNFSSNYALALADDPNETQQSDMIYIKLDSQYRSEYGLQNNPDNMGDFIEVSGERDDYFSHDGVEYVTSIQTKQDNGGNGNDGGDTSGSYYDSASGLTGSSLKTELHTIIDDHTELSYDDVWGALRVTDQDPYNSSNVLLLYTGRSQSKYENGGNIDDWNREHVWAKSHGDFGTTMGAGTDIHHLRPTDSTVNSSRGNKDFDNGGSAQGEAAGTYADADSWEPRDEVKGDVARMVFYMAVRYEGGSGEPDLEVANYTGTSGSQLGKLSTLKQWHEQDPVSTFEERRNDIIFSDYQGNRNPFIDHPEYVEQIW
ncbi:endonuclease [Pontibacillus salicampi]|uniref:Endonuclease n=1 Tax=Pontibacillus salicampi TaxID=1449801 RepID=A0ABV6LTD7_9BACI